MGFSQERYQSFVVLSQRFEPDQISGLRHLIWSLFSSVIILSSYSLLGLYLVRTGANQGWSFFGFFVASLALGWTHYLVFIAWVHEASHGNFFRGSIKANLWFGRAVCAVFGVDYDYDWRQGHFLHHKYPVRSEDPQNCVGFVGWALFKKILIYGIIPGPAMWMSTVTSTTAGAFGCKEAWSRRRPSFWPKLVASVLAALVLWFCWSKQNFMLPLAIIASYSVATALNLIKVALEHGGVIGARADDRLRNVTTRFFLDRLIFPFNIAIHFEHHLNYRIPWYALLDFHRVLREQLSPQEREMVYQIGWGPAIKQWAGKRLA